MKKIRSLILAVALMAGFVGSAPVMAAEMNRPTNFTPEKTCEGRDQKLQDQIDRKAGIHSEHNARHIKLQARMETLFVKAATVGADTSAVQAALDQLDVLKANIEVAYTNMSAARTALVGTACSMTAEQWAAAIKELKPLHDAFEATGKAAKTHIQTVLRPAIKALNEQVSSQK